ncbi:MAG: c-type cytochrome [Sulfurimonas sp.]|nr:c-type cytochrome [Sulfurimonas sp.]
MKFFLFLILSTVYVLSASPLYKKCSACHGKKGEKASLNLTGAIAGIKSRDIVDMLKEYKAGTLNKYGFGKMMKGQTSKLSLEDMKEIGAYIEAMPPVAQAKKIKKKKKNSAETLYKKCSACHGKKGEKRSLGVSKIIAGMKAETIIKELKEYKAGNKNLYGFGKMMRGQTARLSDEKIKIIAKYIESLPPVIVDKEEMRKPLREISQEEADFNKFMNAYFRDSKDPNETFEAAKKSYEQHLKNKGKK